ncbi:MAG: hypothetical protein H6721_32725 [Sandaracinus sp.]|nr:hypothetical protein [Sandaracinus sp.]
MKDWTPNEGDFVENVKCPKWGPGKVVLVEAGYVYVFFRDDQRKAGDAKKARKFTLEGGLLRPVDITSDPVLDHLLPYVRQGPEVLLPTERMTLGMAKAKFLGIFPGGFRGKGYIGDKKKGERFYKWAAHQRFVEVLGDGQLETLLDGGQVGEAATRAMTVVNATNLLASFETIALKDALEDETAAKRYLRALAELLARPTIDATGFEAYLRAFLELPRRGNARVHTWPVCTALPYLAQPNRFIHLKPAETKKAAARLAFDLRYDATPNWTTYQRLLDFAELYRAGLADLGCEDMIDVQSFIWVTCGGYDRPKKKPKDEGTER